MAKKNGFVVLSLIVVTMFAVTAAGSYPLLISLKDKIPFTRNCPYPDKDLCLFLERGSQDDVTSPAHFSASSVILDKNGRKSEVYWQSDGQDTNRIINYEDGKETFDMITLGNTFYVEDYTDGYWWKQNKEGQTSLSGQALIESNQPSIEDIVKKKQTEFKELKEEAEFKKIGVEPCGKDTCLKYQLGNFLDGKNHFIYFDNINYLLRKIRSEDRDGVFSDFSLSYDKVVIDAPAHFKEALLNQNIFLNSF